MPRLLLQRMEEGGSLLASCVKVAWAFVRDVLFGIEDKMSRGELPRPTWIVCSVRRPYGPSVAPGAGKVYCVQEWESLAMSFKAKNMIAVVGDCRGDARKALC